MPWPPERSVVHRRRSWSSPEAGVVLRGPRGGGSSGHARRGTSRNMSGKTSDVESHRCRSDRRVDRSRITRGRLRRDGLVLVDQVLVCGPGLGSMPCFLRIAATVSPASADGEPVVDATGLEVVRLSSSVGSGVPTRFSITRPSQGIACPWRRFGRRRRIRPMRCVERPCVCPRRGPRLPLVNATRWMEPGGSPRSRTTRANRPSVHGANGDATRPRRGQMTRLAPRPRTSPDQPPSGGARCPARS